MSDVLAAARELQPWLDDRAAACDGARRLSDDVVAALVEAGMFRLTQPPRYGGLGLAPSAVWPVIAEIGRGSAAAAWIAGLGAANVLMVGKFPARAQDEVFGAGRPAIVPLLTGGVGRDIVAEPADGGVTLSGKWRYASGIDVATWVGLLAPLASANGAEPHILLVPAEAFEIDQESWRVLGMQGTGSKDIALSPTFVPAHRQMTWAALQVGGTHRDCPNDEPVYELPLTPVFAASVQAPTLGVARAAVDEYLNIARDRDGAPTQILAASADATLTMALQALVADADLLERRMGAGRPLSQEERAAMRMRFAVASRQVLETANRLFAAVGGSLLPADSRIGRLMRDLHAMSSHFLLQPEPIGQAQGRALLGLGLPPDTRV
ncbi:MAG: acyl-CoA dehydrogenase family protein [Alphaproteobacteria bacterium]